MLVTQVYHLFVYFVHQNNNSKNTAAINGLAAYSCYLSLHSGVGWQDHKLLGRMDSFSPPHPAFTIY